MSVLQGLILVLEMDPLYRLSLRGSASVFPRVLYLQLRALGKAPAVRSPRLMDKEFIEANLPKQSILSSLLFSQRAASALPEWDR